MENTENNALKFMNWWENYCLPLNPPEDIKEELPMIMVEYVEYLDEDKYNFNSSDEAGNFLTRRERRHPLGLTTSRERLVLKMRLPAYITSYAQCVESGNVDEWIKERIRLSDKRNREMDAEEERERIKSYESWKKFKSF